jgi:ERF superfamily protein
MTEQLTSKASLYKKIAAVAGAVEAVEKDSRNKDQGYRYASPAGIMSAIKPLMAAQSLAIVPHLVDFAEIDSGQKAGSGKPFIINRVSMHYHILDGESGEELVVPWQGQAGTYGDDKGLAKAQTIALRTFLIQLFQIPAEDPETDPDARDVRLPQQQAPQRPPVQQQRSPARPAPAQPAPTQNGASYDPPATDPTQTANGSGQKRPLSKAELAQALRTLWAEERGLGGTVPQADYLADLDTASRDELVRLGKAARARVAALSVRALPRPMEETDLPPVTDDERAAAAA